jgi:hypothetical protein
MYDYKKQFSWAKLRVGIVITAALITLFVAVMFAGNIGKLFSKEVTIDALSGRSYHSISLRSRRYRWSCQFRPPR